MLDAKTPFQHEIDEQPAALRRLVAYYLDREGTALLQDAAALCRRGMGGRIIFTGMGTSLYAATAIYSLLTDEARGHAIIIEAGEFLHHSLYGLRDDDVVVAISQSGESVETVRVAERLPKERLLAITNAPESTLTTLATMALPLFAGDEAAVTTKTYTNTLAMLLLLAAETLGRGKDQIIAGIRHCADGADRFLQERQPEIVAAADFLHDAPFLYFIARGMSLAGAQQASLTWSEGARMPTAALPGGSFRHGPFELVRPGFHGVFYVPTGSAGALMEAMAQEVAAMGGRVLAFSGRGMLAADNLHVIEVEPGEDMLLSLATAVPQELLLARMAQGRGWTAGVFDRGSKVTTRE